MNRPTPAEIRALRQSHGLTQTEAAALIWSTLSIWQKYEAGTRNMRQAVWFALQQKIGGKITPSVSQDRKSSFLGG